jgi:hypothetical protein
LLVGNHMEATRGESFDYLLCCYLFLCVCML